jgi:hypothetical protein
MVLAEFLAASSPARPAKTETTGAWSRRRPLKGF